MTTEFIREILDTLTRNKSRSFLTGFGVFWGVFMLIALIGGGRGLQEMLQKNFDGFATNSAMVFSQTTTKPYKGFKKGRMWNMNERDVERLRLQIPELDVVAPVLFSGSKAAVHEDNNTTAAVRGVTDEYAKVNEPLIYYGRFLNEMDMKQSRKVCVIGKDSFMFGPVLKAIAYPFFPLVKDA